MSLYEGAVKKPIMTSLCFLAVAIFGLFSLSKLPVDLYPDIDTNTIMVMTSYQGASASDIENNVTRPLENTLNSVSNLKHITSKSSENISVITLEFEYGYDIDVLTNDVRDKLDMVSSELPDEVNTPIIFKFSTDMIPILLLSVQAEESQPALYKILDDNVVNPLARVPGVGTVSIAGAPKREVYPITEFTQSVHQDDVYILNECVMPDLIISNVVLDVLNATVIPHRDIVECYMTQTGMFFNSTRQCEL